MTRSFLLSLLTLGFAACQPAEPAPDVAAAPSATPVQTVSDPAADRTAIQAMTAAYQAADRAGDHAAIAALYADDAVILPANKPAARGRAALDAYFAANDAGPEDITFTSVDIVVAEAGDMAYEVGTTTTPDGASKYLTLYRKVDGRWLIVADSWGDDAPPTPAN